MIGLILNLKIFGEKDTCLAIFCKNGTHVMGFLVKKSPFRAAHQQMSKYASPVFADTSSVFHATNKNLN